MSIVETNMELAAQENRRFPLGRNEEERASGYAYQARTRAEIHAVVDQWLSDRQAATGPCPRCSLTAPLITVSGGWVDPGVYLFHPDDLTTEWSACLPCILRIAASLPELVALRASHRKATSERYQRALRGESLRS